MSSALFRLTRRTGARMFSASFDRYVEQRMNKQLKAAAQTSSVVAEPGSVPLPRGGFEFVYVFRRMWQMTLGTLFIFAGGFWFNRTGRKWKSAQQQYEYDRIGAEERGELRRERVMPFVRSQIENGRAQHLLQAAGLTRAELEALVLFSHMLFLFVWGYFCRRFRSSTNSSRARR
ncbi:MAG: hypothetical protein MHM6MM_006272 [Cercozoa sp. M6MM]